MTLCRVCGRAFDPSGFQVVVPGLGEGFDRVECAEIALARGGVPSAPPIPLPADAEPSPAPALVAAAAVPAALDRRPFLLGANVALLAAGTAVTVYLWLRVFAADPSSSLSLPANATPAQERATVPSQIDGGPPGSSQPDRNGPAGASADAPSEGEAQPTASTEPPSVLISNPSPRSPSSNGGGGGGGPAEGGNGGGGGGGGDPQAPEPPKPPAPSPPDAPGKCEDEVGCDDVDDDEDDDDTSDHSRDASARARDGDQSRGDDSMSRGGGQSRPDDSDDRGGDKSKHDSSHGDKTKDESKHEQDNSRAHESGNGKQKGHGEHH
jgi:hypothetical protein